MEDRDEQAAGIHLVFLSSLIFASPKQLGIGPYPLILSVCRSVSLSLMSLFKRHSNRELGRTQRERYFISFSHEMTGTQTIWVIICCFPGCISRDLEQAEKLGLEPAVCCGSWYHKHFTGPQYWPQVLSFL